MARFYDQGKTKLQEKKMSIEVEPNAARKMTRPPGHFAHLVISLLSFSFSFFSFFGAYRTTRQVCGPAQNCSPAADLIGSEAKGPPFLTELASAAKATAQ
jgi:hypothetical protein